MGWGIHFSSGCPSVSEKPLFVFAKARLEELPLTVSKTMGSLAHCWFVSLLACKSSVCWICHFQWISVASLPLVFQSILLKPSPAAALAWPSDIPSQWPNAALTVPKVGTPTNAIFCFCFFKSNFSNQKYWVCLMLIYTEKGLLRRGDSTLVDHLCIASWVFFCS